MLLTILRTILVQGHGWYTQRIREVAETYGYQMALGSIFPMDVLFKDFGAPLAKYCLWKVRSWLSSTQKVQQLYISSWLDPWS